MKLHFWTLRNLAETERELERITLMKKLLGKQLYKVVCSNHFTLLSLSAWLSRRFPSAMLKGAQYDSLSTNV